MARGAARRRRRDVQPLHQGLQVKGAEWLELSRGIGRERVLEDGSIAAQITDELPQRAFYRQWRNQMIGATGGIAHLRTAARA